MSISKTIPVAQYIFTRLRQLNCKSLHGVPGDFFLRALDYTRPAGVQWIGNANELCAGYAADGYARAGFHAAARSNKPRVGAVITTYGVGELSVINAVAGAYAESVPLVQIVGTPRRRGAWNNPVGGRPLHHTLGDGRIGVYASIAKEVTCAQANLHHVENAADAVERYDRALEQCVLQSKPVYVSLPLDMMELPVDAGLLETPLSLERPINDATAEDALVELLVSKLNAASRPLIIADGLSYPFDLIPEVNELCRLTKIPVSSFTAGKGVADEATTNWHGVLSGPTQLSSEADLVIMAGPLLSNTNTAAWTALPETSNVVSFGLSTVEVEGKIHKLDSKKVLQALIVKLNEERPVVPKAAEHPAPNRVPTEDGQSIITQDAFWSRISASLRSDDTLLFANGAPLLGSRDLVLPAQVQAVVSPIWCSIGQLLPAAQGIALSKRDNDLPGRTILFEGDGSFQVTCQALSDIIRYKLDVMIILINNSGYTYERWLNGMDAEYNDVPAWQYTKLAAVFGAKADDASYPVFARKVATWGELEEVLADDRAHDGKGLKMIEVVMEPGDVPHNAKEGLLRASRALGEK